VKEFKIYIHQFIANVVNDQGETIFDTGGNVIIQSKQEGVSSVVNRRGHPYEAHQGIHQKV
jgi:hypothetical protein